MSRTTSTLRDMSNRCGRAGEPIARCRVYVFLGSRITRRPAWDQIAPGMVVSLCRRRSRRTRCIRYRNRHTGHIRHTGRSRRTARSKPSSYKARSMGHTHRSHRYRSSVHTRSSDRTHSLARPRRSRSSARHSIGTASGIGRTWAGPARTSGPKEPPRIEA
jgi:hypothetical protein